MPSWKKSFRSLPKDVVARLSTIKSDNIRVLAGKRIAAEEIASGRYSHLGITSEIAILGARWEIVPSVAVGTTAKRNLEGWTTVRKDLPKFRKYFYHDIQNFGDASRNGWSTVAIPREVYERDNTPPYLFHVEVEIREVSASGVVGVVFSIDEVFSRTSDSFEIDLLFAVNLLQESTGTTGVAEAEAPDFVFSSQLTWDVFPPGNLDEVVALVSASSARRAAPSADTVRERLELFQQFEPTEFLRGLGGNDHYIGAKFADDLVVFENLKYGNALYLLYDNWQALSTKPRSELLKLRESNFDRLVHTDGWEARFALLMQDQLSDRGIRVRVGRNRRRRRAR